MFQEIPKSRPNTPLLDRIDHPKQLRELTVAELPELSIPSRAVFDPAAKRHDGDIASSSSLPPRLAPLLPLSVIASPLPATVAAGLLDRCSEASSSDTYDTADKLPPRSPLVASPFELTEEEVEGERTTVPDDIVLPNLRR